MPTFQVIPPSVEPVSLDAVKLQARVDSDLTMDDLLLSSLIGAARRKAEQLTGRSFVSQAWRVIADAFPQPSLYGVPFGRTFTFPPNAFVLDHGTTQAVTAIKYIDMNGAQQTLAPSVYVSELTTAPGRVQPAFGQVWPPTLPQIGAVQLDYIAGYAAPIAADAAADVITPTLWKTLAVGDPVQLSTELKTGAALPAPLKVGPTYYVHSIPTTGSYKLTATPGGSPIDLTDTGTGQAFLGVIPEGILQWIVMRAATLYSNREEVAAMRSGKIEALPFVDGLLDPYRVVLA